MSFLDVEPVRDGDQLCLQLHGAECRAPIPPRFAQCLVGNGSSYRLGIRASEVSIAGGQDGKHDIPCEVYVVEPMGYCNVISIRVGDGLVRAVVDSSVRPKPKDNIWLCLDCECAHLFCDQKAVAHPSRRRVV